MQIKRDPSFLRALKKLDKVKRQAVHKAIEIFIGNPLDPRLKNHPLKGKLKGHRAISADDNLRIIFKEVDNYLVVIFIDAGSHDRVYRRKK
ncbi:MAG: type II toxin-antitoxin system mRNA interferase toxin, RelE/StbE family [Magnetococcales bacterium]|nr:type II toxin-antitoxin system mRNA interferase toxin, RelE/StbE family [Magnetococcales bacterium]